MVMAMLLNIAYSVLSSANFALRPDPGRDTDVSGYYGASGTWMAFYGIGFVALYAAARVREPDARRRCPSGHRVSAAARFCGECGREIEVPVSGARRGAGS
jgi:hypothetical protein